MPNNYRILTHVDYEPTLGAIEYIDTARVLGKLLTRIRSELGKFTVQVSVGEMDQPDLVKIAVKHSMMALVKSKSVSLRHPEVVPVTMMLKELRTEYRRWDFKCMSESELSNEWYYATIKPFKELYERYVDDNCDPEVLVDYMIDILAGDMSEHIVAEFQRPLAVFKRSRFPNDPKGKTFTLQVDCDHSWGGGQSYVLVITPKE